MRTSKIKNSVPIIHQRTENSGEETDMLDRDATIDIPVERRRLKRQAFFSFKIPDVLYCSISDADVKRLKRYGVRVGTKLYKNKKALYSHIENVENIIKVFTSGESDKYWKEKSCYSNLVPIKSGYENLGKSTPRKKRRLNIDSDAYDVYRNVADTQDTNLQDSIEQYYRHAATITTRGPGFGKMVSEKPNTVEGPPTVFGGPGYLVNFETNQDDSNTKLRKRKYVVDDMTESGKPIRRKKSNRIETIDQSRSEKAHPEGLGN